MGQGARTGWFDMKTVLKTLPLALAAGLLGAAGAQASTIDLTDNGSYTFAPDAATGTVDGVDWTLTPIPQKDFLTNGEAYNGSNTPTAPLAFENDGIGVSGSNCEQPLDTDEVSNPCEAIKISFGSEVTVTDVSVLDLFGDEKVFIFDDNGNLVGTINAGYAADDNSYGGYADGTTGTGALFSTGVETTSLTFVPGFKNDTPTTYGNPDFALAAITVASVPVPAAGLMLLGGLGALAAAKRRRKAA